MDRARIYRSLFFFLADVRPPSDVRFALPPEENVPRRRGGICGFTNNFE